MTFTTLYNTRKGRFTTLLPVTVAVVFLLLSSLACGQIVNPTLTTLPDNSTPTVVKSVVAPTLFATANSLPTTVLDNTPRASVTVVQAVVNVRAAPDNTSATVGYLTAGDIVQVLRCDGAWCKIQDPDGYVWRGCLSDNPDGLGCEVK